ncbi:putative F-box protein At1g64540 [Lolium perenne]|uniref:putative F-box protein At1g64540 n=1 Tax=Lolium perenne TaxID=4522 RepID=UPI003A9960F7
METRGAGSRKRKSAALVETTDKAPAPAAISQGDGGAGRLSSLPDAILGEIISLLATKEGARTRILASRWRHLWLSAPLNLDCCDLMAICRKSARVAVISRILSSHQGPGRRLHFDNLRLNIPARTVKACLRSTSLDNLEELHFTGVDRPLQPLVFRFSSTLRVANIGTCNLSKVACQGLHFPLLKQLGLADVYISECSLHTLIAGCPALECLLIRDSSGFRCLRVNSLTIRSISVLSKLMIISFDAHPVLFKELVIENAPCLLRLLLLDQENYLHVSVVVAPKLETLGFMSDGTWRQGEFSKKVFGSTIFQGLRVDKLITVVQSVKILALDMQNLCLDTVIELMKCFPFLEKLYIESDESTLGSLRRHKQRNLIGCFDMRLKTLALTNYLGMMLQVKFITFFVLNANLLESVTLGIEARNNNEEFLAKQRVKLKIDNKVSRDARFHFTTKTPVRSFNMVADVRDLDLTNPFANS